MVDVVQIWQLLVLTPARHLHAEINSVTKQKSRWVNGDVLTLIMSTQLRYVSDYGIRQSPQSEYYLNSADYNQMRHV